jgi:effector-binding domain-containing protein
MLRIGDFSRIGRVSIKTLRYYDAVDLLKPHQVDPVTGYRYYSFDMLPRLNRILALKELGFSLDQVKDVLKDDLSAEQLRGMLRLKQAEIKQQMEIEKDKLARVEARLQMIEQEDTVPNYDVVIKEVEQISVAAIRDKIPTYPEQGHLWGELEIFLSQNQITPEGPCLTVYHSDEPNIDAEVCEPVSQPIPEQGSVKQHVLPGVEKMATTIHSGPFVTISDAYQAILKWIEANGYKIVGPAREVYLKAADNGSQTDPNTVTEIQFPVDKS